MSMYWKTAAEVSPFLLQGFLQTLYISAAGLIAGSICGFLLGVIRGERVRWLAPAIGGYVHAFRGTPFLVQLYLVYFVLPNTGISWLKLDSHAAAIVALALYSSSYVAEIVGGAIRAVPSGQWEGAKAVGMSRYQRLRHVILPQALGLILPALGGVYVNLIKATSIVSVVGVTELTRQAEITILRYPHQILFIYVLVAAVYFIYCFPVLKLVERLERRALPWQRA